MKKDKYFFHGHDRFAEERGKLWETQQQAADYFGVSRVTWGQCERGNATPSGDVLAGLAQRGADVLYILTGQRSPVAATPAPPDEQLWTETYRKWDVDTKKRELLRAMGLSPTGMEPAATPVAGASPQIASSGGVNFGGANNGVVQTNTQPGAVQVTGARNVVQTKKPRTVVHIGVMHGNQIDAPGENITLEGNTYNIGSPPSPPVKRPEKK